jgi:hypothetical protein
MHANAHIVKNKPSPLPVHLNFQLKNVILTSTLVWHHVGDNSAGRRRRNARNAGCRRHQRESEVQTTNPQSAPAHANSERCTTRKNIAFFRCLPPHAPPSKSTRSPDSRVRAATKSKNLVWLQRANEYVPGRRVRISDKTKKPK